MATSAKQDQDFARYVCDPDDLLSNAVDWIGDNLDPEDVFSEEKLSKWAKENYECDREHVEEE